MFATSIRGPPADVRFDVTQSIPHAIHEIRLEPEAVKTRTDHSRAPGATPTTPRSLSSAPTIPATCVPWPCSSRQREELDRSALVPGRVQS